MKKGYRLAGGLPRPTAPQEPRGIKLPKRLQTVAEECKEHFEAGKHRLRVIIKVIIHGTKEAVTRTVWVVKSKADRIREDLANAWHELTSQVKRKAGQFSLDDVQVLPE